MEPMHNNKKTNDYEWLVDVVVVVGAVGRTYMNKQTNVRDTCGQI